MRSPRALFGLLSLIVATSAHAQSPPKADGPTAGGGSLAGIRFFSGSEISVRASCRGPIVTYDAAQAQANRQAYTTAMAKARARRTAATRELSAQRAAAVADPGKTADTAVRIARIFEQAGRTDAAIGQYRKALAASPESAPGQEAAARLNRLATTTAGTASAPHTVAPERAGRHAKSCDPPIDGPEVVSVSRVPDGMRTCEKCGGGASR